MVRILSNGDIVQDEDNSRSQNTPQQNSGPSQTNPQARRGFVQNEPDRAVHYHMPQGGSMFDTLNQRLLDNGVPRWNLGPYPVEPIVSLGFLIALLLIGLKGLVLALLLFFVCKWSGVGGGAGQGGGMAGRGWQGGNMGGFQMPGSGGGPGSPRGGAGSPRGGAGRPQGGGGPSSQGPGFSGGGQRLGRS